MKGEYITLTDQLIQKLLDYKERTGVSAKRLLGTFGSEVPQGLNAQKVASWFRGAKHKVKTTHLDFVFQKYEELIETGNYRIEISPELLQKLQSYDAALSLKDLFAKRTFPEGLSMQIAAHIVKGNVIKANKRYIDFLTSEWPKAIAEGHLTLPKIRKIKSNGENTGESRGVENKELNSKSALSQKWKTVSKLAKEHGVSEWKIWPIVNGVETKNPDYYKNHVRIISGEEQLSAEFVSLIESHLG